MRARTYAWRLLGIDGLNPEQQAFLASIADPVHNELSTGIFDNGIFHGIGAMTKYNSEKFQAFSGLFTIEWE